MGRGSGWMGGYQETVIHFGTYNIHHRRKYGINLELWGVAVEQILWCPL